eukprot:508472-Karenia_brevis.AAC.1
MMLMMMMMMMLMMMMIAHGRSRAAVPVTTTYLPDSSSLMASHRIRSIIVISRLHPSICRRLWKDFQNINMQTTITIFAGSEFQMQEQTTAQQGR